MALALGPNTNQYSVPADSTACVTESIVVLTTLAEGMLTV